MPQRLILIKLLLAAKPLSITLGVCINQAKQWHHSPYVLIFNCSESQLCPRSARELLCGNQLVKLLILAMLNSWGFSKNWPLRDHYLKLNPILLTHMSHYADWKGKTGTISCCLKPFRITWRHGCSTEWGGRMQLGHAYAKQFHFSHFSSMLWFQILYLTTIVCYYCNILTNIIMGVDHQAPNPFATQLLQILKYTY